MPRPNAHGTPAGYDDGCRGANCQHHGSKLHMTCAQAKTRYAGDWSYMRAVDAGTADTLKATYLKPKTARLVAETREQAAKRPKVKAPRKPRAKAAPREAKPRRLAVHGSVSMYAKGCKVRADCPLPAGEKCSDVMLAYGRAHPKPGSVRRQKPQHGTESGYSRLKCRTDCPAEVSCTKVTRVANRDRKRVIAAAKRAAK